MPREVVDEEEREEERSDHLARRYIYMARHWSFVAAAAAGCGATLLLFTMMTMISDRGLDGVETWNSGRATTTTTTTELAEQPEVVYLPGGALQAQAHLKAHYQGRAIEYMPLTTLKKAGMVIPSSISVLAENATNGTDAANGTDAGEDGGGDSIYYTADASCAISNLVSRAKQIIPYFELCGYVLPPAPNTWKSLFEPSLEKPPSP